MSFANYYLERKKFKVQISFHPNEKLNIIVVIPCFNEPDLILSLESLWKCIRPDSAVEVIVVINSSIDSPPEVHRQNLHTYKATRSWVGTHQDKDFKFYLIYQPDLPAKYAGAGLARKIGMDEAVDRFNKLNNDKGVIVSLDADTIVDSNFLTEIEKQFKKYPETNACSIYYEHPTEGNEFSPVIYKGIILYELFLRYFVYALRISHFPYAYHTIGSCFVVKALTYVKQGGMNKKKAGEDFYFLQKIIPLGNFFEINTTKVVPSPRPSNRVPFGTGPMIQKFINNNEKDISVYNFQAFLDLKEFLIRIDHLFKSDKQKYEGFIIHLPESIRYFLINNDFYNKLSEINQNCSTYQTFRKRFYYWFNAFKILKYLNFSHEDFYSKVSIIKSANELLRYKKFEKYISNDAGKLLEVYRKVIYPPPQQ